MIDQLHQFPDIAAATAAFPWPLNEAGTAQPSEVWGADGVSVMLSAVRLLNPAADAVDTESGAVIRGTVAASGVWLGIATEDAAKAEALRALPSFRLQYARPETPTPWREAVTHTAEGLDIAALPVASAGMFAGSGYLFD